MKTPSESIFSAAAQKLALFPSHLEAWRRCDLPPPITLEIQPTERCNHSCPDCQARYTMPLTEVRAQARRGSDLDLSLLESVWEEPPAGVVLSGSTGDPLLHPRLPELLEDLRRLHIPTVLVTNGEALTREVARLAVQICRGIRVSLDAADADGFLRTHGRCPDGWHAVLASLRILLEARCALAVPPAECAIGVGYLTDDTTRKGMVRATVLARSLGVDYIHFRPFHYRAVNINPELAICRGLETGNFRVLSSNQKYERAGTPTRSYNRCHGANFFTALDARGDLYLCCHHVGKSAARFGSLADDGWSRVIRSTERRAIMSTFDLSECVPLCRLHAHNEMLETDQQGGGWPLASQDPVVRAHSVFL